MYSKKLGTSIENAILKNKNDIEVLYDLIANKQLDMPDVGYYDNNVITEYKNIGMANSRTYFTYSTSNCWYYNDRLYCFEKFTDTSKVKVTSINLTDKTTATSDIPSTLALTTSNFYNFELFPDSKGKLYVYLAGTSLFEYDFVNNTNTVINISGFDNSYRLLYTGDTLFLYNSMTNIKKYENSAWVDAGLALDEYFADTYTQDEIKGNFAFFQIFEGIKYIITMDTRYIYKYLCLDGTYKMMQLECTFPKCVNEPQLSGSGIFHAGFYNYISKVIAIDLKTNKYVIYQIDGVVNKRIVKDYPGLIIQHYKTYVDSTYVGMGEVYLVGPKYDGQTQILL